MGNKSSIIDNNDSQSVRELRVIKDISQNIIGTLDYNQVLQIISDGMSDLFEIETAAIYTLENEVELYLSATTPPLDPQMPDYLREALLADHPHALKSIVTQEPVIIPDTRNAELSISEKNIVEMRQLRSLIFLPFVQEEMSLGVLILGTCNKAKVYNDHQIKLCQTLSNQLSTAILNARLYKDLKNHKDNLEKLIIERTSDLEAANAELQAANDKLQRKSEMVLHQKNEIESILDNLKIAQTQLIQSEKMASLGILTAGVAHEINNPLNFIMRAFNGLEEIHLEKSYLTNSERISIFLDCMETGINRASAIVTGLNQFGHSSKLHTEDCDLHLILDNCLTMINYQLKHRVTIEKSYHLGDHVIKGNVGDLHQVFLNILNNAEQAIKKEGTISIKTIFNSENVEIVITDTGEGISPENLEKISDPFFTTKDPGKGTGLGLSIVYNLIKEHLGTLDFKSELGKGTEVKVTLPIGG